MAKKKTTAPKKGTRKKTWNSYKMTITLEISSLDRSDLEIVRDEIGEYGMDDILSRGINMAIAEALADKRDDDEDEGEDDYDKEYVDTGCCTLGKIRTEVHGGK